MSGRQEQERIEVRASHMTGDSLFMPLTVADLTFANRVFMAPMTRSRAPQRLPTPLTIKYYSQRSTAGLIFTEASQISLQGIGSVDTPGVHTDEQAEHWHHVTDAVHERGGRIFSQLWHQGRTSHPMFLNGELPVAPSAIAAEGAIYTAQGPVPYVTPRALTRDEIARIVADYARAAAYAKAAGFDGVELHCANGYLPMQFLEDGSNRRTDDYGGSVQNRLRFAIEIVDALAATWPMHRVSVRISPQHTYNGMYDSAPDELYGRFAEELSRRGVGFLHLIELVSIPDASFPAGRLAPLLRKRFQGALILNGGYDGAKARSAIDSGIADAVSFGESFLANPDLPARLAEGVALNVADRRTFFGGGAQGYTDYPSLERSSAL